MVLRLVLGILTAVFLPLGIVFTILGFTAGSPDRGEPEDFRYAGLAILALGLVIAAAFLVLLRQEAARRRRRRAGLRATAEIVEARMNPSVRTNGAYATRLTVRFAGAGTSDGTVTTSVFVAPYKQLEPGQPIEILYDPQDPANFEPAASLRR